VPTTPEDAETVFIGFPKRKVSEAGLDRVVEDLPRKKGVNLRCVISRIRDKYYWASRENVRMIRIESGVYSCRYMVRKTAAKKQLR